MTATRRCGAVRTSAACSSTTDFSCRRNFDVLVLGRSLRSKRNGSRQAVMDSVVAVGPKVEPTGGVTTCRESENPERPCCGV